MDTSAAVQIRHGDAEGRGWCRRAGVCVRRPGVDGERFSAIL